MTNSLPSALRRRSRQPLAVERLYMPAEVAAIFGVNTKTVTRWAKLGQMDSVRTPGGHRRFREAEVRRAYEAGGGMWQG